MGVDEFYDYLPKHFWNKLDGFYELENIRERSKVGKNKMANNIAY